jgi:hypothetical protein
VLTKEVQQDRNDNIYEGLKEINCWNAMGIKLDVIACVVCKYCNSCTIQKAV